MTANPPQSALLKIVIEQNVILANLEGECIELQPSHETQRIATTVKTIKKLASIVGTAISDDKRCAPDISVASRILNNTVDIFVVATPAVAAQLQLEFGRRGDFAQTIIEATVGGAKLLGQYQDANAVGIQPTIRCAATLPTWQSTLDEDGRVLYVGSDYCRQISIELNALAGRESCSLTVGDTPIALPSRCNFAPTTELAECTDRLVGLVERPCRAQSQFEVILNRAHCARGPQIPSRVLLEYDPEDFDQVAAAFAASTAYVIEYLPLLPKGGRVFGRMRQLEPYATQ